MFFEPDGALTTEFQELYYSLFRNPEPYVNIIRTLGKKRCGLTRNEIINSATVPDNGNLSKILDDLEYCGFIRCYNQIGAKSKNSLYQLTDFFTLFYFQFMAENKDFSPNFWTRCQSTAQYSAWSGLAFERVCFAHLEQIKRALGISGVACSVYPWRSDNAQIDMVIDRSDGVVNLCEMKFYKTKFSADAAFEENLLNKRESFQALTHTQKSIHLTLITFTTTPENQYTNEITNLLTINNLFEL